MKLRTLKNIKKADLKNKRVIVRCDFNVPLNKKGEIIDDFRISQTLPTINYLVQNGVKVILMSHLGDPEGEVAENLRLNQIQEKLMEYLDLSIAKASDWNFNNLREWIGQMRAGEILLLENLRFHPGEEANDENFAKALSSLGDIYVNDGFGTCHRVHASIVGVPKYLPSYVGLLLEKEISVLSQVLAEPKRPLAVIMGGAKVSTKIKLIEKFLKIADNILLGGVLANTILKAKGMATGKSIVDEEMIDDVQKLNIADSRIHLPIDVIVAKGLGEEEVRAAKCRSLNNIASDELIFDIGPETQTLFSEIIGKSKTVFWNGPLGYFEKEEFAKGTESIARVMAKSKSFKVIGGGDVVSMLSKLGLADKMDHISTGGGAMLKFLSGEELPGIKALQ